MKPITFGAQMSVPQCDEDMVQTLQAKNPMAVVYSESGNIASTLRTGGNDHADTYNTVAVAFSCKDSGADAAEEVAPTLRSMNEQGGNANAGGQVAVAMNLRGREGGAMPELDEVASLRAASGGSSRSYVAAMQVRRLTPVECARLQGFPDTYLDIPYRNKPAADGPKYKALGNSMAVPVMRWIGERIQLVQDALEEQ